MELSAQIEALLFWKAEPISAKRLVQILKKEPKEIESALLKLEEQLVGRGLCLVYKDDEVTLATARGCAEMIETLTKEELTKDLGKAGLETLSIVIYRGPVSRSEIDYIRGVNSNFILRNLLVRGLVERVSKPGDERSYLYKPTFDLLAYIGVKRVEDLPEYTRMREEIETLQKQTENDSKISKADLEETIYPENSPSDENRDTLSK